MIREYAQGPNCLMYCLPTGGFNPEQHKTLLGCAQAELSEEVGGMAVVAPAWAELDSAARNSLVSHLARNLSAALPDPLLCTLCTPQAMLAGGEWVRLLPAEHPGFAEVKWCANRFVPFLVLDPRPDFDPGSRDAEEVSIEVRHLAPGAGLWLSSARGGAVALCACW